MFDIESVARSYDRALSGTSATESGGSVLMLSGLPASGKSVLAAELAQLTSAVWIRTDAARRLAVDEPTYSDDEVMAIYNVCHRVIQGRLQRGERVVFDGSNHRLDYLHGLFDVVTQLDVPLAICVVTVDAEEARRRLLQREMERRNRSRLSDAGWEVYGWMRARSESMPRPHLILDSTRRSPVELAREAAAYWWKIERCHTAKGQSDS
jgi:predicted kinase